MPAAIRLHFERRFAASVKKVAVIRCNGTRADAAEWLRQPLCEFEGLHRDQLGHRAKVLNGGCEDEFIARAVWAS